MAEESWELPEQEAEFNCSLLPEKNNFQAGDNSDRIKPQDSDNAHGSLPKAALPQPTGAGTALPKGADFYPCYRNPVGLPPYADNRVYVARNSAGKPPGSRYLGKNFDPNYRPWFKGYEGSPRFVPRGRSHTGSVTRGNFGAPRLVPRGRSPTRSADRGNFGAPHFEPWGQSPNRSAESDNSSDWEKDTGLESAKDANCEKDTEPPQVPTVKEAGRVSKKPVEEMFKVLQIDDNVEDSATAALVIAEENIPNVEEEPFGPKKFIALGLASRQAELAKKYERDCAAFLSKSTTLQRFAGGKNFCELQEFPVDLPTEKKLEVFGVGVGNATEVAMIADMAMPNVQEEPRGPTQILAQASLQCKEQKQAEVDNFFRKEREAILEKSMSLKKYAQLSPPGHFAPSVPCHSLLTNPPSAQVEQQLPPRQFATRVPCHSLPNNSLPADVEQLPLPRQISPSVPCHSLPNNSLPAHVEQQLPPRQFATRVPCHSLPNNSLPAHVEQQLPPRQFATRVPCHSLPNNSLPAHVEQQLPPRQFATRVPCHSLPNNSLPAHVEQQLPPRQFATRVPCHSLPNNSLPAHVEQQLPPRQFATRVPCHSLPNNSLPAHVEQQLPPRQFATRVPCHLAPNNQPSVRVEQQLPPLLPTPPSVPCQLTPNNQPSVPVEQLPSQRQFAPSKPCHVMPNNPSLAHVELLQLAPGNSYSIVVDHVGPGALLWVRVTGGESRMVYDRMLSNLATAYADHTQLGDVLVPMVGCCYAAFVRSAWHRVMLTQLRPSGIATVFLLDVGREEMIPFQECRTLVRQFTKLPGLTVCCVLDGFEEFGLHPIFLEYLEKIVNGNFVAEVVSVTNGKANVYLFSVELYGLEVNYDFVEKLGLTIAIHRDMLVGQTYQVRMPHVSMSGSVFVRVEDDANKLLRLMSRQLERKMQRYPPKPVTDVQPGSPVYFIRCHDAEHSVRRVMVLAQPPGTGMVFASFLDTGDSGFVPVSSLCQLEGFFDPLWILPPQAIQVSLTSLPPEIFSKQMVRRLKELIPTDRSVLMKVVGGAVVPDVELFIRLLPENILVSVNVTLALEPTLRGPPILSPSNAASSVARAAAASAAAKQGEENYLSLGPPLPFPPIGVQFGVDAPVVSSANKIMVQPWNTCYVLNEMMLELLEFYSALGCENTGLSSWAAPGPAYGALRPDGSRYGFVCAPRH